MDKDPWLSGRFITDYFNFFPTEGRLVDLFYRLVYGFLCCPCGCITLQRMIELFTISYFARRVHLFFKEVIKRSLKIWDKNQVIADCKVFSDNKFNRNF